MSESDRKSQTLFKSSSTACTHHTHTQSYSHTAKSTHSSSLILYKAISSFNVQLSGSIGILSRGSPLLLTYDTLQHKYWVLMQTKMDELGVVWLCTRHSNLIANIVYCVLLWPAYHFSKYEDSSMPFLVTINSKNVSGSA